MTKISTEDFNIKILRVTYFNGINLSKNTKFFPREVYDYEIEFYTNSEGGIIIDGKHIKFETGTTNFRRPGQIVCGIPPYSCYSLCFNLLGNNTNKKYASFGCVENKQENFENEIINNINNKIVFKKYNTIEKLLKKMHTNFYINSEIAKLELKADIYTLLKELYENSIYKEYNRHIINSVKFIETNLTNDINVIDIANHLSISTSYLQAIFKEKMKITPKKYINKLRIEKAKFLLIQTNLKIADVGFECGFLDNVYFTYIFGKFEGISPSVYREKNKGYNL